MTSIVDVAAAAATPNESGDDLLDRLYKHVLDEQSRFLDVVGTQEVYSAFELAMLVHELVTEHTAHAIPELMREIDGTATEPQRLIDLLVATLAVNDSLRAENERVLAALAAARSAT